MFQNASFRDALSAMISRVKNMNEDVIIVDKTGYPSKIDIEFSKELEDIEELKSELNQYDLDLIIGEEELSFLIISDKVDIRTTQLN